VKYTDADLDRIDAMVAEFVMGYTFRERRTANGIREVEILSPDDNAPRFEPIEAVSSDHLVGAWHLGRVPQFTRDGSAMLEVVEKMLPNHHVRIEGHWRGAWTVQFCVPSTEYTASEESLPVAVCLAALYAVGHPFQAGEGGGG